MTFETARAMLPPIKVKKTKKKAPVVTPENRYAKYLEDEVDANLTAPEHYKNSLKSYRKPSIENSF